MKKCKNPQCVIQISENAPDFCPDHNTRCCEKCEYNSILGTPPIYCLKVTCSCHSKEEKGITEALLHSSNNFRKEGSGGFSGEVPPTEHAEEKCSWLTCRFGCTHNLESAAPPTEYAEEKHPTGDEIKIATEFMKVHPETYPLPTAPLPHTDSWEEEFLKIISGTYSEQQLFTFITAEKAKSYYEGEKMELSMRGEVWEQARHATIEEMKERVKNEMNKYHKNHMDEAGGYCLVCAIKDAILLALDTMK